MAKKRWTNKELEEISDIEFAMQILIERRNELTNIYTPLYKKLQKTITKLENIKNKAE